MKRILFVVAALLLLSVMVYSQAKQPVALTGTQQYTRSLMRTGVHDFTADSGGAARGASRSLCGYCHAAHVPATGIAAPLWVRASVVDGGSYGVYSNPISLDITPADVKGSDNYSSFCMGCHDGSDMFVASAYEAGKRPFVPPPGTWTASETLSVPFAANIYNGEYALTHTHPVNFDYGQAVTADPGALFPALATGYVYLDANNGNPRGIGRLFNGTMQCSSCHNPHFRTGIGLVGSTTNGALCVACHRK